MVRIGNVNIPDNKNLDISLTYVYGIGRTSAKKIVNNLKIDQFKKTKDLNEKEIKEITEELRKFKTEGELKKQKKEIIDHSIRLGTYSGLRRTRNLPVNGQRTRHNARTCKGHIKKTVANKKKAPKL